MKRNMRLIILVTMGLAAGAQRGAAGTWYVAPSGSDSADGTNWATALLTISNAVAKTQSNDTVLVSNGLYTLTASVVITNRITLRSWNNGSLDRAGTVLDGGNAVRCLWASNYSVGGLNIYGVTLSNGNAMAGSARDGGGLYGWGGMLISNCVITCNVGSNGGGAYLYAGFYSMYYPTVVDSTINANTAYPATNVSYQGGGGVSLYSGGAVKNCVVSNNYAEIGGKDASGFPTFGVGGGILFVSGGTASGCTIVNNASTNGAGGGAYFRSGGTLKDSTLANNSSRDGGGANLEANAGNVSWCVIEQNWARRCGGGVRMVGSGTLNSAVLRNCLIRHNTAQCIGNPAIGTVSGGGGVAYEGGAAPSTIDSCTIVSNTAATYGGGLHVYWAYTAKTCMVFNTICYFNTGTTGSNWNHYIASGGTVIYSNNCFAPSVAAFGEGNIDSDPKLKDIEGGNFKLSPYSPCIDAGLTLNWMTTTVDLDGTKRIVNDRVDMGAYEFFPAGAIIRIR